MATAVSDKPIEGNESYCIRTLLKDVYKLFDLWLDVANRCNRLKNWNLMHAFIIHIKDLKEASDIRVANLSICRCIGLIATYGHQILEKIENLRSCLEFNSLGSHFMAIINETKNLIVIMNDLIKDFYLLEKYLKKCSLLLSTVLQSGDLEDSYLQSALERSSVSYQSYQRIIYEAYSSLQSALERNLKLEPVHVLNLTFQRLSLESPNLNCL